MDNPLDGKRLLILFDNQNLTPRIRIQLNTMLKRKMRVTLMRWVRNQKPLSPEPGWINIGIYVPSPYGKASILLTLPELYQAIYREAAKLDFDIIQASSLTLLPLALHLSRKHRVPVIYDAYEFYALHYARYFGSLSNYMCKFFEILENRMVARVNGVFCVDSQNENLFRRYKRVNSNCEVLNNYPLLNLSDDSIDNNNSNLIDKETLYLAHVGDFRLFHGAPQILAGYRIIRERMPNVGLLLIGSQFNTGALDQIWQQAIQQKGIKVVSFLPYPEMVKLLRFAKLGLALMIPSGVYKNIGTGTSRKIFNYMEVGLPLLVSRHPMLQKIVRETGCGIVVDESSPEAVAEAACFLLENPQEAAKMGAKGREAVRQNYNWEKEEPKFWRVYQQAMHQDGGRAT